MAEIIRMPRLSDTMEEGNIVSWEKKVGDEIKVGDILAEVETDKATMELESFNKGTLLYIGVDEGTVPVDGIIAIIGNKGEDYKKILAEAESVPVVKEEPAKVKAPAETAASKPITAPPPTSQPVIVETLETNHNTDRIFASPLAKKLASSQGIDMQQLRGSGDGGRIIKKDIENYIKSGGNNGNRGSIVPKALADFKYGEHPVSQMRKVIAKRLGESKFTSPHFYLTVEINMDKTLGARKAINEDAPPKISINDFVLKAAAVALRKNPKINSSWHGDKIVYHQNINIGVAVAVDDGLVVPVVKDTDQKSLGAINQEVRSLAGKARSKKIRPEEMQGNTFTISNLGMYGIEEFTAIINPPDACILAVGGIQKKPIVKNDAIQIGSMMRVTLSSDHRVVDGATGAEFLNSFKSYLENPIKLFV